MRTLIDDLVRWEPVEVQVLRMLASALALAGPVAIGVACGQVGLGLAAALGGLLVASGGHRGTLRHRVAELCGTGAAGVCAVWVGMEIGGWASWGSVALVLLAVAMALLGSLRRPLAVVGAQVTVFAILGMNLGTGPLPRGETLLLFACGAAGGALATLCVHGVARLVAPRLREAAEPGGDRSLRADAARWWAGLRHVSRWQYPLRLGACLTVAEVVAHLGPGSHSYWIALTVSLVVQRDHGAVRRRTVQRAVGTAVGVAAGALLLHLSSWAAVGLIAAIGAVRAELKEANYTAYAAVMTMLVLALTATGGAPTPQLLRERLVDTLLGCLIGIVVSGLVRRALPGGAAAAAGS
ncbi:FUSC family protein [Streptomyces polyrhachis]|uniref:FUSC family protein n=1 Tax=Streptomyces polyrhachis TaxID=1282885 RepID=A0ABW2GAZ8_9ACTN